MSFYRKHGGDLLALGGFLLLTLLCFWPFLDGRQILGFKDLSRYFYPLRYLMAEQVLAGQLPLWNPYIYCGFPLLATLQIGFFYPLTAIHYLLPFNLAFNYYSIAHYFLAAAFTYALLRHFAVGRPAAFFGGLAFAFSGYLLSVSNMNTSLSSVIWLPLAVLLVDRLTNSSFVLSSLVPLTIVLALMFLGGEPTILYVSAWFLAAYVLVFSTDRWRHLLALAAAGALAAGLVAVQVLPFLELVRLSDRTLLTGFDLISTRSLPPREVLNFILPFFFGNAGLMGGYNEVLLGASNQDWLISIYFGVIPLIGAFFARGRKQAAFLGGAALFALLLAFGRYTWFYTALFYLVPGISLVRYPVKYLFLFTFCASLLAAFGLENIFSERTKMALAARIFAGLAGLAVVMTVLSFMLFEPLYAWLLTRYPAGIPNLFFAILLNNLKFNLASAVNLTLYLLAAAATLWLTWQRRLAAGLGLALLILLTALDLLANGSMIAIGVPAEVYSERSETFRLIARRGDLSRVYFSLAVEKANQTIAGENYADALRQAKDDFAANWHIPSHLYAYFGYESIRPVKLVSLSMRQLGTDDFARNLPTLSAYNVGYILHDRPIKLPGLKLLRSKQVHGRATYLYRNENVKPRAYLVSGEGSAAITSYQPGRIALTVTAETTATLFLSESSYPGWQFRVDGRSAGEPKPNAVFSSLALSPGRHRVEFIYEPMSLKLGALISGLTGLLLIGLSFWVRRR